MRIATLNTWGLPEPFSRQLGARLDAIVGRLAGLEVDAIAFQEVWTDHAQERLQPGEAAGLPRASHASSGLRSSGLLALAAAVALGSSILLGLPAAAGADGDPRPTDHRPPKHRGAEMLLDMKDALGVERTAAGHFQIRNSCGLEYVHRFNQTGGGPPLIMSISGPRMARKRLGLSIEFRF